MAACIFGHCPAIVVGGVDLICLVKIQCSNVLMQKYDEVKLHHRSFFREGNKHCTHLEARAKRLMGNSCTLILLNLPIKYCISSIYCGLLNFAIFALWGSSRKHTCVNSLHSESYLFCEQVASDLGDGFHWVLLFFSSVTND